MPPISKLRIALLTGLLVMAFVLGFGQKFQSRSYSLQDGLAQSQVMSMVQDANGYIWMGTAGGGVSRFDGLHFRNYSVDHGLAGGEIGAMVLDKQGWLWFACNGRGISIFDGYMMRTLGEREGVRFTAATKLYCAKDSSVWLGTEGEGLYRVKNDKVSHFGKADGLNSDTIHSIVEWQGLFLVGTTAGIYSKEGDGFMALDSAMHPNQPTGSIGAMLVLHNDELMGSSGRKLWRTKGTAFEYEEMEKDVGTIADIFEDRRGRVWIAGAYLAAIGINGKYTRLDGTTGFKESGTYCFIEDRNGNIWMGTEFGGAFKFSEEAFSMYGIGTPFLERAVFAILEINADEYWVGTEKGLFSMKGDEITLVEDFPSPGAFVYGLNYTEKGEPLVLASTGAFVYQKGKFKQYKGKAKALRYASTSLGKDRSGNIFISNPIGIYALSQDSLLEIGLEIPEDVLGPFGYWESQNGDIWLISERSGVLRYRDGKLQKRFSTDEGLPSDRCLGYVEDYNGVLWLATYDGLARIKNDEVCYFSHREGLASSLVYILIKDAKGDIWAGTSNGLSRLRLNRDSEPVFIRNYGIAEGFSGIECNQAAGLLDSKGRLWFGTVGGLACYIPEKDRQDVITPQIQLQRILVNMEELNWGKAKMEVMPWDNVPMHPEFQYKEDLRFEFSGITHRLAEKVKFRYKLLGYQENFGPLTEESHISYTLLPPGEYTLQVLATNAAGVETRVPFEYSFVVQTPWYRSQWFFLLSFLVLIGTVSAIVQLRTRNLQKQRAVLERKVAERTQDLEQASKVKSEFLANMSHEIRTPMNGVIGMTDLLQRTPLNAQQQKFVENIRLSGQNLLNLINDILDFSRIESGKLDLEAIPFELRHSMEEVLDIMAFAAFSKGLELLYWVDPKIKGPIVGDPSRFKQILVNLVGNAIKFTSSGEIIVKAKLISANESEAEIEFMVQDSGIGIPKEKHAKLFESFTQVDASTTRKYGGTGLGLAISYNLTKVMGGEMWLESEPGMGARFYFSLKAPLTAPWSYDGNQHPASGLKGMKVLVATRHRPTQKLLMDYLNHWQAEAQIFSDIETATDSMLNQLGIDMVLVDLRLVNGDPKAFSQRFRKLCEDRHLRFGLLAEPDIALMLQNHLGPKGLAISKPIKRDELISALAGETQNLTATVQDGGKEKLSDQIPLSILVAEDNPINQDVAMGMLSSLGYEVRIANNGLEALEITLAGGIDLIFMDVQMPVMDGLEASAKIVAELERSRRPLIVAMTANAMESDRQRCLAAGMDTFISKPFMMAELEQLIRQLPAFRSGETFVQSNSVSEPEPEVKLVEEKKEEENAPLTNLAMLNEVSGGEPAFVIGILKKMLVKLPEALEELKTALSQEDWETIRATSHRSKSSSAYTGAEGLKHQFMELEHMARDRENLQEIPARLATLEATIAQVLREIEGHLANLEA